MYFSFVTPSQDLLAVLTYILFRLMCSGLFCHIMLW